MKKPGSYLSFLDAETWTKKMKNNSLVRPKEEKNVITFKELDGKKRLVIYIYTDLKINSGLPPQDAKDGQVNLSLA